MEKYIIQLIPTDDDKPLYLVNVRPSRISEFNYNKDEAIRFNSFEEAESVYNRLHSNRNVVIKKIYVKEFKTKTSSNWEII